MTGGELLRGRALRYPRGAPTGLRKDPCDHGCMLCTVAGCELCSGAKCRICDVDGVDRKPGCMHDMIERHSGMRAIEDETRIEEMEEPAECRVPTRPIEALLSGAIDIDHKAVSGTTLRAFLLLCSKVYDAKGRIKVCAEVDPEGSIRLSVE